MTTGTTPVHDPIDFVVTWVNSDDGAWRARRDAARREHGLPTNEAGASDVRHREWGLFRYWFRSVEQYCPWVRRVHVVIAGDAPAWLDVSHPKLRLIPDQALLGHDKNVFNSHAVESRLPHIEGLSEKFVYFNDDFYIGQPLAPGYFFPGGMPYGVNVPTILADGDDRAHAMLNASGLINRHFTRSQYWRHMAAKTLRPASGTMLARVPLFFASTYIPPVSDPHVGMPFLRSVLEEAFAAEPRAIEAARTAVFRSALDVAPLYYATMWHLATGRYTARSKRALGTYFSLSDDVSSVVEAIRSGRHPQICINDAHVADVDAVQEALVAAFQDRLPQPSTFERNQQ